MVGSSTELGCVVVVFQQSTEARFALNVLQIRHWWTFALSHQR